MERVSTLLKKLQQQLDDHSPAASMLQTVHLLQAELISKLEKPSRTQNEKVAVVMPVTFAVMSTSTGKNENQGNEEKVVEVLQVDEKELEQELEQLKRNAASVNAISAHGRPPLVYDPIEEVPTLSHQDPPPARTPGKQELPFEYPESLNDRLKEVKIELSQALNSAPIKDLKKAIGVNDRFLFINELFRGDEAMYERSIKTIQNFSILPEAEYWIKRELKVKIGWVESDPVVKQFDQLIKRRFS
jgi:hypothetical protein